MRSTHVCPKCSHREILFVPRVADRDDHDNVRPLTLHVQHLDWKDIEVGTIEAYVCRGCGYTELYTVQASAMPIDKIPGAVILTPKGVALPMRTATALAGLLPLLAGCATVHPPASAPPTADAALARMHATFACANAVQASAKIDHFGKGGRIRADLMLFAARPARIRMDVLSPFGVALATLTSDGERFGLADLREKVFYAGPAAACNIARLTTVPMPGHVLVDLLRGEAPVLKHDASATTIAWDPHGFWSLAIPSTRGAREEIHLAPRPDDWNKPWEEQRLRVLDVRVVQQGYVLYHAELSDFSKEPTAGPRVDPDNIDPPIPPSGPVCDAEAPRKIHVEVPSPEADVRFVYQQLSWNPPLPEGTFVQQVPPGMRTERVSCEE